MARVNCGWAHGLGVAVTIPRGPPAARPRRTASLHPSLRHPPSLSSLFCNHHYVCYTPGRPVATSTITTSLTLVRARHPHVGDADRVDVAIDGERGDKDPPTSQILPRYDFIVLGSGIAGLTFAMEASVHGSVALVTKGALHDGCTPLAQGGVSAVLDQDDSWEKHAEDTIVAGAYLNDAEAVRVVCQEGPARVLELAAMGAAFTLDEHATNVKQNHGRFHLAQEGGHSARRVVHAADATGAEIHRAQVASLENAPNVTIFTHHHAVDLVVAPDAAHGRPMCIGVDLLDPQGRPVRVLGLTTLLATGGAGQVYPSTTNPRAVTGDGIAMAHRAGAAVANMEFVQFHPTSLYQALEEEEVEDEPGEKSTTTTTTTWSPSSHSSGRAFLISEAVRGEGGYLRNHQGERFMTQVHALAELAPRDIVSRAIFAEMKTSGQPHVWLDVTHVPREELEHHFPMIMTECRRRGLDPASDLLPVVPAQHYVCGGVATDLHGATSLPGLYACGEVAHSGLHGANRLASNSLLEGLVFGYRAVPAAVAYAAQAAITGAPGRAAAAQAWNDVMVAQKPYYMGDVGDVNLDGHGHDRSRDHGNFSSFRREEITTRRNQLRSSLWLGAGIVRDASGLQAAVAKAKETLAWAEAYWRCYSDASFSSSSPWPAREVSELINLATIASMIAESALARKESRGGHFRDDCEVKEVIESATPGDGGDYYSLVAGAAEARVWVDGRDSSSVSPAPTTPTSPSSPSPSLSPSSSPTKASGSRSGSRRRSGSVSRRGRSARSPLRTTAPASASSLVSGLSLDENWTPEHARAIPPQAEV